MARYQVRLSVPRVGGWRAVRVESWVRRGRDYLQVVIAATVDAADVADALDLAWQSFRKAAGDDAAGRDMSSSTAEVRPGSA